MFKFCTKIDYHVTKSCNLFYYIISFCSHTINILLVQVHLNGFVPLVPHMHLLIFLKGEYKLLTSEVINTIISAKWPDPDTQPWLFEAVKSFIVHGPCGALNPKAPCMRNGKCKYGYPKPFQEHTIMDQEGYPQYSHPNDRQAYQVGAYMLDNRWIMPYSPFCLLRFFCHTNVECAICFASAKYINKYMDKGGDCGTIAFQDSRNEVKRYIDGHYITPPEVIWWVLQFKLHSKVSLSIFNPVLIFSICRSMTQHCSSPNSSSQWTAHHLWSIFECPPYCGMWRNFWYPPVSFLQSKPMPWTNWKICSGSHIPRISQAHWNLSKATYIQKPRVIISAWKSTPVWFLPFWDMDQDWDQSNKVPIGQKTGLDRSGPVFCSLRLV